MGQILPGITKSNIQSVDSSFMAATLTNIVNASIVNNVALTSVQVKI